MVRSIVRTAAASALFCLCTVAFAQTPQMGPAQSPATNPIDSDFAKQQQQRQVVQPLNNQPVWSEVRSGTPQFTSIPGRETNVLIQSQGQTWRALRTPLMAYGGGLIVLAVVGLAAFYLWRGSLDYERHPGDRLIERFSPMDRFAHWLLAICWVTLAITGLILSVGKSILLPLIGYTLFSWLAILAKNVHNFVGPILIFAIPLLFARFVRDNGIGARDVKWFANIVGYFKGHEYPSGRFNAGEKAVFWLLLVVLSTTLLISGLVLLFPNFDQTRSTMQTANVVHMIAAYIAIALACVHIYLGTLGMTQAYRAMRYGYVDESWAKHHHALWYEDVVAGRAPQKIVEPGATVVVEPAPTLRQRPA